MATLTLFRNTSLTRGKKVVVKDRNTQEWVFAEYLNPVKDRKTLHWVQVGNSLQKLPKESILTIEQYNKMVASTVRRWDERQKQIAK